MVSYLSRQGGTRPWSLWEETLVHRRLKTVTDMLSREEQVLPTKWTLDLQVVRSIFRQ